MAFFGLGGGGLTVEINVSTDPTREGIIELDHAPGWKVRKNPFMSLQYPNKLEDMSEGPRRREVQPSTLHVISHSSVSPYESSTGGDLNLGKELIYAYEANEDIVGTVTLSLPPGKRSDHLGIKIQFIGRIDMTHAVHEGRPHYDFISLSKELSPPGVLYNPRTEIPFYFRGVEKFHETYRGRNVIVRYFIRVEVERKYFPPITQEHDLVVQILGDEPPVNEPIKMEVGIEDCLHIEFEYERRYYHLRDMILGKINFLLVRIRIKHMELAVIRRETSGEGLAPTAPGGANAAGANTVSPNALTETQTLIKYEIMDGAPVKGETIPVRLYLQGIPADLTPTYNSVNNRFSVRYFLNLVLVDEEDRRYFKQQEIFLWRKDVGL
jgi:vacuolar protein sorting-associated protein 26|eukprot:CAMPEP_0198287410 /NCGR_PEP_ID=MMETSP1449-20131203/6237_1 /TAXON_ID=420275 /ORGANISM="Attheya septentrionalis, Strain CCMP2084" /LENGTH=380 /DNA_ID=CAMNT_0043985361 /DNA_START=127 /DNA_END=1269 /DNA_ORIENTATION=+